MKLMIILVTIGCVFVCSACNSSNSIYERAVKGDPEAQFNLGRMYDVGKGVPIDYDKAVEWYRKSAEQGYAEAQFEMCGAYSLGLGAPYDPEESFKWIEKAAVQGYPPGMTMLSYHYANGYGTPKDLVLAYAWLILADFNGPEHRIPAIRKDQIEEAQKLAAAWKPGQVLERARVRQSRRGFIPRTNRDFPRCPGMVMPDGSVLSGSGAIVNWPGFGRCSSRYY